MQDSQEDRPVVWGPDRGELRLGDGRRVWVSDTLQDREDLVLDAFLEAVVGVKTMVQPLEDKNKVLLHWAFECCG